MAEAICRLEEDRALLADVLIKAMAGEKPE